MTHATLDYHFQRQAYSDGLTMGLCHEMAVFYATATVRLDQLDHMAEERPLSLDLQQTHEQLRVFVDLCFALRRVEAARTAPNTPSGTCSRSSALEVLAA